MEDTSRDDRCLWFLWLCILRSAVTLLALVFPSHRGGQGGRNELATLKSTRRSRRNDFVRPLESNRGMVERSSNSDVL